jgi:hypothetical protein
VKNVDCARKTAARSGALIPSVSEARMACACARLGSPVSAATFPSLACSIVSSV